MLAAGIFTTHQIILYHFMLPALLLCRVMLTRIFFCLNYRIDFFIEQLIVELNNLKENLNIIVLKCPLPIKLVGHIYKKSTRLICG